MESPAGSGKTNLTVALAAMLHEMGLINNETRFTVFGKQPRKELTSRGVPGVKTMHSMGLAALTDFNNSAVQEEREMKETGRAKQAPKVTTTVSHVKQNLLVTMALEIEFGKDFSGLHIFVKVFRKFVRQLSDLARTRAFGAHTRPLCCPPPLRQ